MSDHSKGEKKPTAKPDEKAGAATPQVFTEFFEVFKHFFSYDLNAILSLADPELRALAHKLATELKGRISADNWLRSSTADRALSFASSKLESAVKGKSKLVQEAFEKVSDFIDAFQGEFFDKSKKGSEASHGKVNATFEEVEADFLKRASVRIGLTPRTQLGAVKAELEERWKGILALHTLVQGKNDEPTHSEETRSALDWIGEQAENLRPFNDSLEEKLGRWEAAHHDYTERHVPWKPSWFARAITWPIRFFWRCIFGSKSKMNPHTEEV